MNDPVKEFNQKLLELEQLDTVSEHSIATELNKLAKKYDGFPCIEMEYEYLSFSFMENAEKMESDWGYFYGPMMTWTSESGELVEFPSLKSFDESTVKYWEERLKSTSNALFRARYAGLIWEFKKKITNIKPVYSIANDFCESVIEIANKDLGDHEVETINKLKKALSLAITNNNNELIEKLKTEIIIYEDKIADDSKAGLWGFSYDLLIHNQKVTLSESEKEKIIDDLTSRLERLADGDPWAYEYAAERLANYYKKIGEETKSKEYIKKTGERFISASDGADGMLRAAWLEHVYELYIKKSLHDEAEEIALMLQEVGPEVLDEMKTISTELKIDRQELEEYANKLIEGDLHNAISRIAVYFVESKQNVTSLVKNLSENNPISYMISRELYDDDGRKVASVGSIPDDLDGHIVVQMSNNIRLSSILLDITLLKFFEKYSVNEKLLIDCFFESIIFDESQREFIDKGIEAYFEDDYLTAVHLLVPQIERCTRSLIEKTGGVIYKKNKYGGFSVISLHDAFTDEIFISVFGENTSLYLRVILTDHRGWNIRNMLSHGLMKKESFNKDLCNRILHILLIYSLIRPVPSESD